MSSDRDRAALNKRSYDAGWWRGRAYEREQIPQMVDVMKIASIVRDVCNHLWTQSEAMYSDSEEVGRRVADHLAAEIRKRGQYE